MVYFQNGNILTWLFFLSRKKPENLFVTISINCGGIMDEYRKVCGGFFVD
jgi:hypothetical protein